MDQHGGAVVEQMGVVDEDQERTPTRLVEQLAGVLAQELGVGLGSGRTGRQAAWEERGERTEGEATGRFRPGHRRHGHALLMGEFDTDCGRARSCRRPPAR